MNTTETLTALPKPLQELQISDILEMPLYAKTLESVIDRLTLARTNASRKRGPLKRHVIDYLKERGLWNAPAMTELYAAVMDGNLPHFSSNARAFIRDVGNEAFNRTMTTLTNSNK